MHWEGYGLTGVDIPFLYLIIIDVLSVNMLRFEDTFFPLASVPGSLQEFWRV